MLRYCAWCGQFQGPKAGEGHQIRKDVCEIDTMTICPPCLANLERTTSEEHRVRP